jgi:hypothetical protein
VRRAAFTEPSGCLFLPAGRSASLVHLQALLQAQGQPFDDENICVFECPGGLLTSCESDTLSSNHCSPRRRAREAVCCQWQTCGYGVICGRSGGNPIVIGRFHVKVILRGSPQNRQKDLGSQ